MKERPIIFKDEMVRAILDGRKTQTRRVVKQPKRCQGKYDQLCPETLLGHEAWWWDGVHGRVGASQPCPYGQPGDRLWVREAWGLFNDWGFCDTSLAGTWGPPEKWSLAYRADHHDPVNGDGPHRPVWRPSIHMPRWASRILLEVVSVRVERLQEISAEDARAEGCLPPDLPPEICGVAEECIADERTSFAILWNRINGPGSWATNPWVWVVEFRRIEQESAAA